MINAINFREPLVLGALSADPATPVNGVIYYNTGSNVIRVYQNGAWVSLGTGSGTVTSVALADGSTSPIYTISGSPVTTSGTLTFTLASQLANTVFAAPNGSAGQPGFRALVAADIPSLNYISSLTGDVTTSTFGAAAATLATVNTNTGSWGSSTAIPSFTVNGKGLITAASSNVVIAPAGTLSGTALNSTVVSSSLTSLGAQAQALNMNSYQINNLANGTASSDAATYGQLSAVAAGLSWKNSVLLATAAALPAYTFAAGAGGADTLTATAVGVLTVDGVATVLGNTILVKNETNSQYNGIYDVTTAGTASVAYVLTRDPDMRAWSQVPGSVVVAEEGTANADLAFICTSAPGGTLDTTAITFGPFGTYLADGTTLQLVGNTFSVKSAGIGTTQLAAASVTYAKIQAETAATLLGNPTGVSASPSEITLGATLAFVGSALETDALTGDVTSSANSFVTTVAKIAGVAVGTPTGTGNVVFSASPTLTGTLTAAAANFSGLVNVADLTASEAVFTDASKNLVSNAITGSGNVVMSASPTLTGTIAAAAANFSGAIGANGGISSSGNLLIDANAGAASVDLESSKLRLSADGLNFFEEQYLDALSLAANVATSPASLSYATASYGAEVIEYSMTQATTGATRVGKLRVVSNNVAGTVSLTDDFAETADAQITASATIATGTVTVTFTNANASDAVNLRAFIKRFRT